MTPANEKLHQFLNDVLDVSEATNLEEVVNFILVDDSWTEVRTRIETISQLANEFKKKNWNFEVIEEVAKSCQLLKGSVSLVVHVSDFFKHQNAENHVHKLISGDTSPAAEQIDEWIEATCQLGFSDKAGRPEKANAGLFASVLLAARYPDKFADFRQNRWKSLADYLGLEVPQGSYGERLIQVGELVRMVSETSTYQTYFPAENANAIVGGLAYLIKNKDRWLQEMKGEPTMTSSYPLNTILYGPPGTGKTYQTANMAVGICTGGVPSNRAEVKAAYDKLVVEKRVQFVSFHQSYSYEDFLEGIRPVLSDGDSGNQHIAYELKEGIFKKICDSARGLGAASVENGGGLESLKGRRYHKMSVGGIYDPGVESYCFENDCAAMGWGGDIDYSVLARDLDHAASRKAIAKLMEENNFTHDSSYHVQALYWFKDYMQVGDLIIVPRGLKKVIAIGVIEGEYEYRPDVFPGYKHFRKVRWLIKDVDIPVEKFQSKQFSQQTIYTLDDKAMHLDYLESLLVHHDHDSTAPENHVLIIDEINRANISKVLGELITLIEPDKRMGAENAISLRLPYSGKDFYVPGNLYIIGTMNTADRSIALMDTALRRRFVFQEVAPDPAILDETTIDGIEVGRLLRSINDRIEYYYDRDHTIGHAFLMNLDDLDELRDVILQKVVPLLQEYFYEDWEKVRHVLGGGAANIIQREKLLAPDDEDFDDRYRYVVNRDIGVEEIRAIYEKANPATDETE